LVGAAGMPEAVVSRLNAETVRGMTQADMRDKLARQGLFVVTGTPKDLITLMQNETVKWAKVVKAAGIKIE
jgi:tripartite-type tricarboxylate transporter receptor subunit TctC